MLRASRATTAAVIAVLAVTIAGYPCAQASAQAGGSLGAAPAHLSGEAPNDLAGTSLAGAGDVNGDGFDDILIGAPAKGATDTGAAYVVLGGPTGWGTETPLSRASVVEYTGAANEQVGSSVASAGDVNGDGFDDVLVGAPLNDTAATDAGAAYLVLGSATPTSSVLSTHIRFTGEAGSDRAGTAVAGAGDVNGDGRDDLIIGAPVNAAGGAGAGAAYVVLGTASPVGGPLGSHIRYTGALSDAAGTSVGLGDFDSDGLADAIVGAPGNDGGPADSGAAYIEPGSASPASGPLDGVPPSVRLTGEGTGDAAGTSVALGDVTGDGRADAVVGAPLSESGGADSGAVFVVPGRPGSPSNTLSVVGQRLTGEAAGDRAGTSVAVVGDVDRDSVGDFVVGAPLQGSVDKGSAYLVHGAPAAGSLGGEIRYDGQLNNDKAGTSVGSAGDVNGDAIADVLVGAPENDIMFSNAGAAYLLFGSPATAGSPSYRTRVTLRGNSGNALPARFRQARATVDFTAGALGDGSVDLTRHLLNPCDTGTPAVRPIWDVDSTKLDPGASSLTLTFDYTSAEVSAAEEATVQVLRRPSSNPCGDWTAVSELSLTRDPAHNRVLVGLSNATSIGSFTLVPADDPPPTIQVTAGPATGSSVSTSIPGFTFTSNEGTATFRCRVDEAAFDVCSSPHATAPLAQGVHTFRVKAVDAAGNSSEVAERTFTVDTGPPAAIINSGPANGSTSSERTPSMGFASAEPGLKLACRVDAASFQTCTSPVTIGPLDDGVHTFTVFATDAAGNQSGQVQRTWTVDSAPPTVNIDSGTANGAHTADATPQFAFSSGDAGATFRCQVDGSAFAACASPHTTAGLGDGEHTFAVRATDTAGNASDPLTRTFTVDTQGPIVTIGAGPGEGATARDRDPLFGFEASEQGAAFECRIDGGGFQPCTSPRATDQLPDGTHTFVVRATDRAGNASGAAERTWTIDATGPRVEIGSGPAFGSLTRDASPTFAFRSSEGGSSFLCRFDNEAFRVCSGPAGDRPSAALADGTHTFMVRSIDGAQNAGDPLDVAFTVDTRAPDVALSGPRRVTTRSRARATFKVAATDRNPGAVTCQVRRSGRPVNCAGGTFKTPKLRPGSYTVVATAIDQAGNQKTAQKAFKVVRKRVR